MSQLLGLVVGLYNMSIAIVHYVYHEQDLTTMHLSLTGEIPSRPTRYTTLALRILATRYSVKHKQLM